MPSESEHKRKYLENKGILENEMNVESSRHYNWVTTIAFYAAVHLVEGELAKSNIHNTNHADRGTIVERYASFKKVRSQYKFLHDKSVIARYAGANMNREKAERALSCLKDIEKEIHLNDDSQPPA